MIHLYFLPKEPEVYGYFSHLVSFSALRGVIVIIKEKNQCSISDFLPY